MKAVVTAVVVAVVLVAAFLLTRKDLAPAPVEKVESTPPLAVPPPSESLPGDRMMAGYGKNRSNAIEDLKRLHGLCENYLLLHKELDPRHWSTNRELVDRMLDTENGAFISPGNPALRDGELVDPFGHPVFLHHLSANECQIICPGEDGRLYTDDDLAWPP